MLFGSLGPLGPFSVGLSFSAGLTLLLCTPFAIVVLAIEEDDFADPRRDGPPKLEDIWNNVPIVNVITKRR